MKILVSADLELEVSDKAEELLARKTIESIAREEIVKKIAKTRLAIIKGEKTKPVKVNKLIIKLKKDAAPKAE